MNKSPTVDSEGNFFYEDGCPWNPRKESLHSDRVFIDYDRMIIELLMHEELFSSPHGVKLTLFVSCNDIFIWGSSDAEDIKQDEIPVLYDMWVADKVWGTAKWCAFKRNQRPQEPVVKRMKAAGVWDEQMEALP